MHRIKQLTPASNVGHPRYAQVHAKFLLWKLPYERVAYYDLDVIVKRPASRCSDLCPSEKDLCAVKDTIAMGLLGKSRDDVYFNSGVLILTPSLQTFRRLRRQAIDGNRFADQDALNRAFKDQWHELPPACNWHVSDRESGAALGDASVWNVHAHKF